MPSSGRSRSWYRCIARIEKYPEAEKYARRVASIAEQTKGPEAPELAAALITWGDLLRVQTPVRARRTALRARREDLRKEHQHGCCGNAARLGWAGRELHQMHRPNECGDCVAARAVDPGERVRVVLD